MIDRANLSQRTCLSHWFPLIEADGVPVPRTQIIRVPGEWWKLRMLLDGEPSEQSEFLRKEIAIAASLVGGAPFFLRTGQGSGKHDWSRCCYVTDPTKVLHHVAALVEWSEMVDMLGLPCDVWVVREMLPTTPLFRCTAYGGFPVVREFRVFVDGDKILYRVPYWPDGAIKRGEPDRADWRETMEIANALSDVEEREIAVLASRAGQACGGKWSVDVLRTRRGWFVTDMAAAELSYGWRVEV